MDKFFDIIKKLRPGVQSGKVSREKALAELMQETGVSEDIADSAVTKMMPASGGITTLPEAEVLDVSFKPGVDKRGKRVEESPSQASGAKEKTSWKDYVEEESPSQGSGFANIDPDILSLGQKDRFEYEMAKYKQEKSKRMQPIYKKYGALSEKDKELIDELYEYNLEGEFVPTKGNPKYINNSARTFMQESVEDIPGVDEDLVLDILYSKESERFLKNQGVDNYINYVQTRFKEIGLNFNKPLLKRFLKDRYGPEEFSVGGRVGFFKGAVAGGGNISPGTDVKGNVRNDNPFTGGGGGGRNNNPPPVVKTPPPVVKTPPPKPKVNKIVEKLKLANTSNLSPFQKFMMHNNFVDQLKARRGKNYHELGGFDFMARFPNTNPNIAKGLASAYQNVFAIGRAVADGPGGKTIGNALDTAEEEARLNSAGIDAF